MPPQLPRFCKWRRAACRRHHRRRARCPSSSCSACTAAQVRIIPELDVKLAASAVGTGTSSYQKWSKGDVSERAAVLRLAAEALEQQMPRFCALLVKEAFKTGGDAVSEVREAVDF